MKRDLRQTCHVDGDMESKATRAQVLPEARYLLLQERELREHARAVVSGADVDCKCLARSAPVALVVEARARPKDAPELGLLVHQILNGIMRPSTELRVLRLQTRYLVQHHGPPVMLDHKTHHVGLVSQQREKHGEGHADMGRGRGRRGRGRFLLQQRQIRAQELSRIWKTCGDKNSKQKA